MTSLSSFLTSLSDSWKAFSALAGAVSIGFACSTLFLSGRVSATESLTSEHTTAILEIREDVRELSRGDSLILVELRQATCLLTLPEDVRTRLFADPLLAQTAC